MDHDSRTDRCLTEYFCGDDTKKLTHLESDKLQRNILKNDYLVKTFLKKYPGNDLDVIEGPQTVNIDHWGLWRIDNNPDGALLVKLDRCYNIVDYYLTIGRHVDMLAIYPIHDAISDNITAFEKKRYDIAKMILGIHPPPKIQINEFSVWPDKIQCNEPQELYRWDDSNGDSNGESVVPACLTSQIYEMILKQGAKLSRYDDPKNTQCGESLELYRRGDTDGSGNDTPVCLTPQTYGKLLKRGMELGRYGNE